MVYEAPAAVAMVWRWLYNSEFGLINNIFNLKVNWISDPNLAVYSIGGYRYMVNNRL